MQTQFALVTELLDPESDSVVPRGRFSAIGAEEAVPNREIETEIAVRFLTQNGVVNAVHIGRDHDRAQQRFEEVGNVKVTMVEHRGDIQKDFEEERTQRRNAQERNRAAFDEN